MTYTVPFVNYPKPYCDMENEIDAAIKEVFFGKDFILREQHRQFESNIAPYLELESVTLDEFFKDKERRIDVIKMDIEGAEMGALSGMKRILKENKNLKLFVEFYFPAIRRTGVSPEEFARILLEDYHFSVLALGDWTKDKKYMKINKVDELLSLCRDDGAANLFLEKGVDKNEEGILP